MVGFRKLWGFSMFIVFLFCNREGVKSKFRGVGSFDRG